jgi:hypothetical protein
MFQEFQKIPRLNRPCVITEKIDGTNAQVLVIEDELLPPFDASDEELFLAKKDNLVMMAGSRSRWISPKQDNHGFAKWVQEHADDLFKLGVGRHYGEWWGQGIQRKYGQTTKRFSLFNTYKWGDKPELSFTRPNCCDVVPVLYEGPFNTESVQVALYRLGSEGSKAAPGFMDPEGLIIYHTHGNLYFKVTLKNDEVPKSLGKRDTNPT